MKPFQGTVEGKQRSFSMTSGGVTFRDVTVRDVIAAAYGLKPLFMGWGLPTK